jgi:hypothetical protein
MAARRRRVRALWWTCAAAALAVSGPLACTAAQQSGQRANAGQHYDYGEVKRRLRSLPLGATTIETIAKLGSPAERRPGRWIYRQERSGLLIPSEYLVLRFEEGRYVAHEFKPVLLGEEIP